MTTASASADEGAVTYSFVTKTDDRKSIELMKTNLPASKDASEEDKIKFKILKGSLTANNKFYLDFGDKPPFHFFKCYPVDFTQSSLISPPADGTLDDYAHPCVWGIAEVTESKVENVQVGTKFRAMLPIGESVSFRDACLDSEDDSKLTVDRPATNPAYNVFSKLTTLDDGDDEKYEGLSLACFPGIITGFGLNHNLRSNDFYGADAVIVTSASSKVALALALYLKYNGKDDDKPKVAKKIIGYTSESNKEFCRMTGLYDEILGYDEALNTVSTEKTKYTIIDIAGQGKVYSVNMNDPNVEIVKFLTVGASSGAPPSESAFKYFSIYATVKMVLDMMNILQWLASYMNPVQELYLVFKDMADYQAEVGIEQLQATVKEYERLFCRAASTPGKEWITVRNCESEESIQAAFSDIVQGTIPPSETIVLDVVKAVAHRK